MRRTKGQDKRSDHPCNALHTHAKKTVIKEGRSGKNKDGKARLWHQGVVNGAASERCRFEDQLEEKEEMGWKGTNERPGSKKKNKNAKSRSHAHMRKGIGTRTFPAG
jgi:hypothetical protein